MTKPSFAEWIAHWGERRLAEIIARSQKCYRGMWRSVMVQADLGSFQLGSFALAHIGRSHCPTSTPDGNAAERGFVTAG